jgi:hypothetical protein
MKVGFVFSLFFNDLQTYFRRNGRERIALTMRHQKPDRVPVMCQLSIGHYNLNAGYRPHEIWYEPEALANAAVKLARRYGFDGILVSLMRRPKNYLDEVVSLQEDEGGQQLTFRNGDRVFLPWDDLPQLQAVGPGPLRADFHTFDPDRDMDSVDLYPGYNWNVLSNLPAIPEKDYPGPLDRGHIPEYSFRTLDLVKEQAGNELSIHGVVYSPFTHFLELFGYESALTGLFEDAAKAHAVLERLSESVIVWGLAQLQRGVDAINHPSAFVAPPFMSRRM